MQCSRERVAVFQGESSCVPWREKQCSRDRVAVFHGQSSSVPGIERGDLNDF